MRKIITFFLGIGILLPASAYAKTDFFELCKTGTPAEIAAALKAGARVDDRDEDGTTPLMYAAEENKNPEVVRALLAAGADAKIKSDDGKTALDYARENESLKNTKVYWELKNAIYK